MAVGGDLVAQSWGTQAVAALIEDLLIALGARQCGDDEQPGRGPLVLGIAGDDEGVLGVEPEEEVAQKGIDGGECIGRKGIDEKACLLYTSRCV